MTEPTDTPATTYAPLVDGKRVDVTVTYLEQTSKPASPLPHLPQSTHAPRVSFVRAKKPPVHFYRYLYRLVGDSWHWVSRRRMDDDALTAIIHDENVYVYVLYIDGVPGGLAEIDGRDAAAAELKFLALAPDFIGTGVGLFFLRQAIDAAWALAPKCVRLETCTLDHPAALPLYQRCGFSVVDRREGTVTLIDSPPPAR